MNESSESIEIKKIFGNYFQYWKYFLVSFFLFMCLAFLYIRYSTPIYQTTAKILIQDDEKSNSAISSLSLFKDLGILGSNSNLNNEIEIITSRIILQKVVQNLNLQTQYFSDNSTTGIKKLELYYQNPYDLIIIDSIRTNKTLLLNTRIIDQNTIEVTCVIDDEALLTNQTVKFNQVLDLTIGKVAFHKTSNFSKAKDGDKYEIKYAPFENVLQNLASNVTVSSVNKEASVLSIEYKGPIKEKNENIVNELILIHEQDRLNDKNDIAKKTSSFIDERMKIISEELSAVDNKNLEFKQKNQLIDVQTDAETSLEKEVAIEQQILSTGIQLNLAKFVSGYLEGIKNNYEVLPSNLGFNDASIGKMIDGYNELVMKRAKFITYSSEKNPVIIELEGQIKTIKSSLKSSLSNLVHSSEIQLKSLKSQQDEYKSQLAKVPSQEKDFRDISRQQQIKESLYLYLLQKREENQITLTANVSNTKVIDYAYTNQIPISPKSNIIYLAAFIISILFPAGIIYLFNLLNTKVRSSKDVEHVDLPIIGTIPEVQKKSLDQVVFSLENPHSYVAESIRMLRTNLSFMTNMDEKSKVLLVTSTIPNEGKTLISINIAHSFAMTGKRVIIVGMDLRAPKLLQSLHLEDKKGVSNYLIGDKESLVEGIHRDVITKGLDVLGSGPIPPNPSELLLRPNLEELMNKLKTDYDIIILDTPPTSLVTDTMLLRKFADTTLYLIRINKLDKQQLKYITEIAQDKLTNIGLVLNSENLKTDKYSYSYGYGYGSVKRSWFKKIFQKQ